MQALGDGLYRVRSKYRDPKTERLVELDRVVTATSVQDAARQKDELRRAALAARSPKRAARQRLRDAAPLFVRSRAASLKPSTAETYALALDHWIDKLGDHFLDVIDPDDDVHTALLEWRAKGASVATINGRLRVLRTFARVSRVPQMVEGVRALSRDVLDDEDDDTEDGRGLDPDELRRLLAVGAVAFEEAGVRDRRGKLPHRPLGWWWPLIATLAWTGARFGEASALGVDHLDDEERIIRIRRAHWRGIVGHPKSKLGRRDLVIPDELADVLREHRQRVLRSQHPKIDTGLLFPARSASGLPSNTGARKAMLALCTLAGIDLDGRPALHCLRHAYNNLLRQVASELVRQSLVGHADAEIGKRYSKVGLDEKRAAMGAVVKLVRGT